MTQRSWTNPDGTVDESRRGEVLGVRGGQSPLGITGAPSDIAYAMLYLAVDAARFVTGQVLRPNGGVVMS
jgi:3-oxoacyl-[acyl-carrier protein] reductase